MQLWKRNADRFLPVNQRQSTIRYIHKSPQQQFWIPVGIACAGLFVGTRYVLRAQERIRRRNAGLPEDDDDEDDDYAAPPIPNEIFSVDFGSSNLRASTYQHSLDRIKVLENADGKRAIPAAVAVDNDVVSVGSLALNLQGRKPKATALATRLLLFQSAYPSDQHEAFLKRIQYEVSPHNDSYNLQLDGQTYSTEWAAEMMFDRLSELAFPYATGSSHNSLPVVLPVPASATNNCTSKIQQIASSAGFETLDTIPEPIAALHASEYWSETAEYELPSGLIAVFDMGGYESSLSLVRRHSKHQFELLSSRATLDASGKHVDDALFHSVVRKFQKEFGIDLSIDPMASHRIVEAVEAAKKELSTRRSTDINLPFITADQKGAKHLIQTISSYDIHRACERVVEEVIGLSKQVLSEADMTTKDVKGLVLVGGGVRTPWIKTEMEKFFQVEAFGTKDYISDEAVVVGAAAYGRSKHLE